MEGYVVLAFDDRRYMDLAANLALSVRRAETRPISVVTNRPLRSDDPYRSLFDHVIVVPDDIAAGATQPLRGAPLRGAMNKLRLPEVTPYQRTLYLDADCLLFSPRITYFWQKYRGHGFAVEGHRQATGAAFACSLGEKDAATLCALLKIPFIAVFNAGVIYFEKGPASDAVFAQTRALYEGPHRDAISYRYKHAGEYADEPFFGAAMGVLGLAPFEPKSTARLQVTTPNMIEGVMDLDTGELSVIKRLPSGKPWPWAGVVCHFCGLAPMDSYFTLADKLRREAGLPLMDRALFKPVVLTANHKENEGEPV